MPVNLAPGAAPTIVIMDAIPGDNQLVADRLREAASLLHAQGASPFREKAYRTAADAIAATRFDVRGIFEREGVRGLDAIPGVGLGIASAVGEMLATGRWSQLERLRGGADPVSLLRMVPGVGPGLAQRIHDELDIDTLEGLEVAAHDGRLESLEGVGPRRSAAVRASLDAMLRRTLPRALDTGEREVPPVADILDVDSEYREKAAAGRLRTIAPKRFNPGGESWLPVMHARRGPWHFTALYSNTALAHKLGRTHDWVVIYFYDGDHVERQCTVVTEPRGPLRGHRIVRGREEQCRAHYAANEAREPA